MNKFSKILLFIVAIAVASWFLPWIYALITPSSTNDPFCAFSPVTGKWIVSRSAPGEKTVVSSIAAFPDSDDEREVISIAMRDSLVPQLYYRQLLAHEQLPDSINGKEVSMHTLKTKEAFFNGSPRDVNKRTSGIWLMMESMPTRVDLTDPEEAFRITSDGIEFIRLSDNTVNTDRSQRFTKAMKSRGFKFPAKNLAANVTSKKAYDEGYLMIDSEGKLFHVKQQAGRPYVAIVNLPDSVAAMKAYVWEENDKSLLGLVVDTANRPYIIKKDGHIAIPLAEDGGKVDPRKESIMVMGNLFNITVRYSGADATRWRAFDADSLELIGAVDFPKLKSTASEIARYIFPFTLTFTSNYDSLAYPRISNISLKSLPLNLLLALVLFLTGIRRKNKTLKWGALVTLPFGIFAFLPFMLLHD